MLLEEKIKAFNSQLIHMGKDKLERALEDQKKIIKEYENRIRSLEREKGREDEEGLNSELFEKQNMILMNLAAKLNERDEVNMHLNEELCAYDRITKETEEALHRKSARIEQLERLLRRHKIAIPDEEVERAAEKREEGMDGVYLEGELTYNVTEKNIAKAQEEVAALREVDRKQKEEIVWLKSELKRKDS